MRHNLKASNNPLADFGFTQGFTDCLSGLVHLGSRFYNPKQMSFLTMDSVYTENRYAYCESDPVNRIDPTGHSWVDWLFAPSAGAFTTLVGTALANSLFTAALGAAALVANVTLTAVTGGAWAVAMAVAAGAAGAVGGALGSLASNYISDKWRDRQVSGSDYIWGAIAGATIGGITADLTSYGNITAGADRALFAHSAKLGASVGALDSGLKEVAAQRIRGENFTLGSVGRIGLAAASGAASGVASGYASRFVYLREQIGRPITMGVIAKGMWARWTD
jgi:RHS repeat-associated protein